MSHLLNNKWSFWIDDKKKKISENWLDHIIYVMSIKSIEDFWSIYNNIYNALELPLFSDYYLFKNDIRPMWEDACNKDGGKISIILQKKSKHLNDIWLITNLLCIGETLNTTYISGITLNIRKYNDRINIWTSTSDVKMIEDLSMEWKTKLNTHFKNNIIDKVSFVKHKI